MRRPRSRRRRPTHGTVSELNITPLLDLVFVLLVIFILATPELVNRLELAVGSDTVPPRRPPRGPTVIGVLDADRVALDGETLRLVALKDRLRRTRLDDPDAAVILRGAPGLDYQPIVTVLEIVQECGLTNVALDPEPIDPP